MLLTLYISVYKLPLAPSSPVIITICNYIVNEFAYLFITYFHSCKVSIMKTGHLESFVHKISPASNLLPVINTYNYGMNERVNK